MFFLPTEELCFKMNAYGRTFHRGRSSGKDGNSSVISVVSLTVSSLFIQCICVLIKFNLWFKSRVEDNSSLSIRFAKSGSSSKERMSSSFCWIVYKKKY